MVNRLAKTSIISVSSDCDPEGGNDPRLDLEPNPPPDTALRHYASVHDAIFARYVVAVEEHR